MRRKCSAWSRISEALRLRAKRICPVAQNVHVSGQPDCEERQSERRAVRGSASAPPPAARPSAVANSALTVPSLRARLARAARGSRTAARCASASRSARREVGHLLVAARAARRPRPDLAGAEARLAAVGERLLEQLQVHVRADGVGSAIALLWLQQMSLATGASMRLAKYLAHAGVASRRAAEALIAAGRVRVDGEIVHRPGARVDERSARRRSTGGRSAGPSRASSTRCTSRVGVVSTARDTHGRPTVVELVAARAGCGCIRSAASTPTAAA